MKTLFYKDVRLTLAQTSLGETTQLGVETVAIAFWFKPFPPKISFSGVSRLSKCVGRIVRDADLLGLKEHLPSKRREMMLSTFNSPSAIFPLVLLLWTRSTLWRVARGRRSAKQGLLIYRGTQWGESKPYRGMVQQDPGPREKMSLFFSFSEIEIGLHNGAVN